MLRVMWVVWSVGAVLGMMSPVGSAREIVTAPGPTLVFQGTRSNPYPMKAAAQYVVSAGDANPCAPGAHYEEILPIVAPPQPIPLIHCKPEAQIVMAFRPGDLLIYNLTRKSYTYRTAPGGPWRVSDVAMVRTTIEDTSFPWAMQHTLPRYFYFFRRDVTIVNPTEEIGSSGRTGVSARLNAIATASYVDLGSHVSNQPPANRLPKVYSAKIIKAPTPMPATALQMTDCTPGRLLCNSLAFTPSVAGVYVIEYRLYDPGLGDGSAGYIGFWTHYATYTPPFPGF